MIKETFLPVVLALILDFFLGDPIVIPHPIIYMGKLISYLEVKIRRTNDGDEDELIKGMVLTTVVILIFIIIGTLIQLIPNFYVRQALLTIVFFYSIARKTLQDEAMGVKKALNSSLEEGRNRVSRIVGRDTTTLDEVGVIKATVETVAENTSDGIIAPIFWSLLLGAPGALAYKAINTMDSMLGYKNKRYINFGKTAAKVDDLANLIPARITGLLGVLTSPLVGGNILKTFLVFIKDRYKHESPNSAQCESSFAGALGVKLNGPAIYEGKLEDKKYINEKGREVVSTDISKSVKLMNLITLLFIILTTLIYFLVK